MSLLKARLAEARAPRREVREGDDTTQVDAARATVVALAAAPVSHPDDEAPTPAAEREAQRQAKLGARYHETNQGNAVAAGLDVFIDQHGSARLALRRAGGRVDVLHAQASESLDHVRAKLAQATGKRASKEVAEGLLAIKRDEARGRRDVRRVHLRIAGDAQESVLLDMADDVGRLVRVASEGYQVEAQSESLFHRGAGVGTLPEPTQISDANEAARVLCKQLSHWGVNGDDQHLVLVWLVECLRPKTPKPILEILGPAGAGKSTLARNLASIVDPTVSGELPTVRLTEADVMAAASQRYTLHLDNASRLTPDEQDLLCRVATGGQISHRRLYEQHDVACVDVLAPVLITSISRVVTRSDARSRTISLRLDVVSGGYQSAQDVRTEFQQAHPRLLGAVCTLLAAGLARLRVVQGQRQYGHRLVDFEQLGEAIHQSLGRAPGWFGELMDGRRRTDAVAAAEDDPLLSTVLEVVNKRAASAKAGAMPPASKWATSPGWAASLDAQGGVSVAMTLGQLLSEVQVLRAWAGSGHVWDRPPANERALRGALEHRLPTLAALGWSLAFTSANNRSAAFFSCRQAARASVTGSPLAITGSATDPVTTP
ncbi:hypothetical protein [Azohydromonas sp.]|uniref:hypothetical protein n=1 Tax=Azohydromonas sp. TaxID=1872666 RepID=UPI002D04FCFD|nr:hypothetical protein [Azohydromonas sp.]HMM84660.1 hypothetical protein [Azohydromonas sp.]